MAHEPKPTNTNALPPAQAELLEGFISGYLPEATIGPVETSYYEQASAHLRDALGKFDADLHTPQRAYDLMAGLSIGASWMEGLTGHGLTPQQSGNVLRVSLAFLLSAEATQDVTLEPAITELSVPEKEELDPRVAETLRPEQTAIIVVDVMDGYCNPEAPLPTHLRENAGATFADLDKAADGMVDFLDASRKQPTASTIFVRTVERPDTAPANLRLKMEVDDAPPVVEKDGDGWDYYKVHPQAGDHEIVKYNYDSFLGTDLDEHLKERGIKTVVIIGSYASVCVETTARTAAQLGYNTFVPADLTADPNVSDSPQTPDTIRKKLSTINDVMGYMPLSSTILSAWE